MSTWDWKALADAVVASREALGWTQEDMADKAGMTSRTVSNVESGRPRSGVLAVTLGQVEQALGWEPGDAMRVLKGGDTLPLQADAVTPDPPKSHLHWSDIDSLQADLDCAEVSVNVGRLRNLLAEVVLLRERLAKYEPPPPPPEFDDTPPF